MEDLDMLEELKHQVLLANQLLERNQLVIYTWGNVSGIDPESKLVVIKPSGVPYLDLTPELMTVTDLEGKIVEGVTKPSTDLQTHLALYKKFQTIGGVAHTHSKWATVWAQKGKSIPCYGTTHADFFYGEIPCTERMPNELVDTDYEMKTGEWIIEHLSKGNYDFEKAPAVLVAGHGPFTWGKDALQAVEHSTVLERVAEMAYWTELNESVRPLDQYYIKKHYERKHGMNAYYGQDQSRETGKTNQSGKA
jgi:L-ribulose-5-phosphate 4-epimerase